MLIRPVYNSLAYLPKIKMMAHIFQHTPPAKKSLVVTALKARIGVMIVGLTLLAACARPGATPDPSNQRTATLAPGTLSATVSATGNIAPESEVLLSFQQPGTVGAVLFDEGAAIKKGTVIAKLDTTDLELSVAQAQAQLENAQTALANAQTGIDNAKAGEIIASAGYSRTVSGARASDVVAARAALDAAQASLDKLKAGPTEADLAAVTAALHNAEAQLKQSQSAYDIVAHQPGVGATPQSLALEQATNAYTQAKANYDKVAQGADAAAIKSAEQQVQSARAAYDKTVNPARSFDVQQAQAQITQAQLQHKTAEGQVTSAQSQVKLADIQLKQAQRRLDQAELRSPMDGVISSLNVKVGESVASQPVVTVVNTSQFHIDITVDEIDIAKVRTNQEVNVTLDSLPGVDVKGTVARISPTSKTVNGVVSYLVRVNIAPSQAALKSGMTANASIVLDKRENVLLVPNWAVRRDKTTGKSFITLKPAANQTATETEVKTGLRNDTVSEILSGAKPGDVVIAPAAPNALGQ